MSDDPGHDSHDDRRCVECDYSLRGLPPDGRCPECGTPYDPDRITVFGGHLDRNHPITTAAFGLLLVPCLWNPARWLALLLAVGMTGLITFMIHRRITRGQSGIRTRLVFHRGGLLIEPPMGRTTLMTWHTMHKCRLTRTWVIGARRGPGQSMYRLRASELPSSFALVANADVWFAASDSQIAAIRRILRQHGDRNPRTVIDA